MDDNKRMVAQRACFVNSARQPLLAGTALACNQYRVLAEGNIRDHALQFFHFWRFPNDPSEV